MRGDTIGIVSPLVCHYGAQRDDVVAKGIVMGIIDQLSKTLTQGVDRARFEAEKLQRTLRLQSELGDIKRQYDGKLIEMGLRAYELHRAGQINSAIIAELTKAVDQLRASLTVKEEELKTAQADVFIETATAPMPPPSHSVPISVETPAYPPTAQSAPPAQSSPAARKACPNCSFQMPATAMFCPNCGARVGT